MSLAFSLNPIKRGSAAAAAAAVVVGSALFVQQASGDAANPVSVTLVGDLQSELGCATDWLADCAATHLSQTADPNVWSAEFAVPVSPAAGFQYKIAIDDDWAV